MSRFHGARISAAALMAAALMAAALSAAALSAAAVLTPALLAAAASSPASAPPAYAELVLRGGRIYTSDSAQSIAAALAVQEGRVVFVGSDTDAARWIGPRTRVQELDGRLVLPGLVDSHIHPLDIVDLDVCDLQGQPKTLAQLSASIRKCVSHYAVPSGGRLVVHQWNYTDGNQPDHDHPTLRAALDAASTTVRIELLGIDAHHGAFNSLALSQARNARGQIVGLTKASLAGDFAAYKAYVGVDSAGEPNGAVNEDARLSIDPNSMLYTDLDQVLKTPDRITRRLNSVGITAILDAMASPQGQPVYDKLSADGHLTVRVRLAQFYDPSHTRTVNGDVDYDSMVAKAKEIRAKYANHPLIRADVIKLFADGVLEGNPFAVPPALPNAPALHPFLQPIFGIDSQGHATVKGYVQTASPLCAEVRAQPERYASPTDASTFMKAHGYHPAQCAISSGQLRHKREVIMEYVKRMHAAGFNMHIHAISDLSVRTALDAIEAARAADGNATTRDALAHIQLADPADVARIGRDHLFVAFTYAWMVTAPDYDVTVVPFFEKVRGNSYAALHRPGSYYESNTYPVRSVKAAGGILTAGSDAPVDTRDPRPFINMSTAITRRTDDLPPLSPGQSISIRDVLEAYTINGARMLGLENEIGSLEPGKSADFIILDQDILALADGGHPEQIATTRVLGTWFRGSQVYAAPERAADTVYLNGYVYTVDPHDSVQEAVAVKDGRIAFVGSSVKARKQAGVATRIVDLKGRMLMPGLVDGHMHPLEGGTVLRKCNLNYERLTVEQMQSRIQACLDQSSAAEPDDWLEVTNWFREAMLPNGVATSRHTLDALKTKRPIFVRSSFGHTTLANSRALAMGGIIASTPDPLGGRIEHEPAGAPSGVLEDAASQIVAGIIPKATPAEDVKAAEAALDAIRKQGVTTFLDAKATPRTLAAFAGAEREGQLTARGHFAVLITPPEGRNPQAAVAKAKTLAAKYDQGETNPVPGITVRNIKLFMDGVISAPACTGAMLAPYFANEGTVANSHWVAGKSRGPEVYFPKAVLRSVLIEAARAGLEPHMHADGDRAVRAALDGIEALRQSLPDADIRAAIAHDEIVDPADFPRYKQLNAIPVLSFQWEKRAPDTVDAAEEYLGAARYEYIEPAGYLQSAGARIAFGSDWPVDQLNEWFAMKVAVTRQNDPTAGEKYAGRLGSDAGLSVATVVRAVTANAAYELHAEREIGTLEIGKFADLIVLDRNLFKVPAQQLADVKVLLTVVGGKVVYGEPLR